MVILTLAAVLLLAVEKIQIYNLWPVTDTSWREAGLGSLRLSTTLSMAVPAGFLLGTVEWKTRKNGAVWWVAALTGAAMMIAVSVLGVIRARIEPALAGSLFHIGEGSLCHWRNGTAGVDHLCHVDDDGHCTYGCAGILRRTSTAPSSGSSQTAGMGAADFDSGLGRRVLCIA